MLLQRLKEETRTFHQQIENNPVLSRVTSDELSMEDYLRILKLFYGFYAPLEPRLHAFPEWACLELDLEPRRKTPLIEKDLQFFRAVPETVPLCDDLPSTEYFACALGVMYVLEGQTLGGAVIAGHLSRTLALTRESGAAFFFGRGSGTGRMWKKFCFAVDGCPIPEQGAEQAVNAAAETFQKLDNWFACHGKTGKTL